MPTNNERIALIIRHVAGRAVLHVGCVGDGVPRTSKEENHFMHHQLRVALLQVEIIGIDINAAGVRALRECGYDHVLVGNAENLPFNTYFHTVVAGELIEHLSNPGRFLAGCRQCLKPAGRIVLSTPNPFSPMYFAMHLKNYGRAFNPEHTLWLCPQTLDQVASRYGFKVTQIQFVDDLRPEITASRWYRTFALAWKLTRRFLPLRLRNTMVAVLERNDFDPGDTQPIPAARG